MSWVADFYGDVVRIDRAGVWIDTGFGAQAFCLPVDAAPFLPFFGKAIRVKLDIDPTKVALAKADAEAAKRQKKAKAKPPTPAYGQRKSTWGRARPKAKK